MDGARVVTVEVRPIQYRPALRKLQLVNDIHFDFCFSTESAPGLRAKLRGKYEQSVYDAVMRLVIENDHEIQAYYQKPRVVKENMVLAPPPHPELFAPAVIIAPTEYFDAFQPYADWLTEQGIRAILISPQTIYLYWIGRDNSEQIRNYMKECYKYGGTYFLFGGDDYFIPVRYGIPLDCTPYTNIDENDSIPCDLYFSDLTGKWNSDNDDYWGELTHDDADCFSEVFVGRITSYTVDEVENWVTKVLHYEKTPRVQHNKALWINDIFYNGPAHNEFPSYFTHKDDNQYAADDALYDIDDGYGFVNLNCHGNIGDFSPYTIPSGGRYSIYSWWSTSPSQTRAGLNWLTNINKYFFVYAICCHSGAYDQYAKAQWYEEGSDTCVADAFVDAYLYNRQGETGPFGACASVMETRSPWLWNELQTWFYDALFRHPEEQIDTTYSYLGVAVALAKTNLASSWNSYSCRHGAYCQNLFGSPATEAWTKTPGNMIVTHPTIIPTGVQTDFTVTVKNATLPPVPLPYAKVCLYKPDDIYEVGSTDANGQVTFSITPQFGGPMKVTVTRFHNIESDYDQYRPSQTLCEVVPAGEGGGQSSGSNIIAPEQLCITSMPTLANADILIKYGVPKKNIIDLTIYDILGARVITMRNEKLDPGYYEERLNTSGLPSGVYFIVLRQNSDKISQKFLLVR